MIVKENSNTHLTPSGYPSHTGSDSCCISEGRNQVRDYGACTTAVDARHFARQSGKAGRDEGGINGLGKKEGGIKDEGTKEQEDGKWETNSAHDGRAQNRKLIDVPANACVLSRLLSVSQRTGQDGTEAAIRKQRLHFNEQKRLLIACHNVTIRSVSQRK